MKCSRISLSLLCTVLSGAAIALGPNGAAVRACDPYADTAVTTDGADLYGNSLSTAHHFCPEQESEDSSATSSAEVAADNAYHYEYPEEASGSSVEEKTATNPTDDNGESAEAYALKYGYHYASSANLYGNEQASGVGQDDQADKATEAPSSAETAKSESSDAEQGESASNREESVSADHDQPADATESLAESTEGNAESQGDGSLQDSSIGSLDNGDVAADSSDSMGSESTEAVASSTDSSEVSTTAEASEQKPSDEELDRYTYDNPDAAGYEAKEERPSEETSGSDVAEAPAGDQQSSPADEEAHWTYQYRGYDSYYGYSAEPSDNSEGAMTSGAAVTEEAAEPETLADYAKWALVYGYSTEDKWLVGDVVGDAAAQVGTEPAPAASAESATGQDGYDTAGYRVSDYQGDSQSNSADESNVAEQMPAETDAASTPEATSSDSQNTADSSYSAEEASEASSYDKYGYEKSYSEPGAVDTDAEAGNTDTASSDHTEIWNQYRYEYYYGLDGQKADSEAEGQQTAEADASATAEASPPSACEFEYEYSRSSDLGAEGVAQQTQADERSDYDYADPNACYGNDSSGERAAQEEPATSEGSQESGLELFDYMPAELLNSADQDLLRTLESLSEEPSGVRRAVLNSYLEALGPEAIDLVIHFEDSTGIEVMGLADDVLGTAALLSTYRLMERGELGHEETADLLRRSLQNLSSDWTVAVRAITSNAYETGLLAESTQPAAAATADEDAVAAALVTLAVDSLSRTIDGLWSASQPWLEFNWQEVLQGLQSIQAANYNGLGTEWFQR